MKEYIKEEKVYIIGKSIGYSIEKVIEIKGHRIEFEDITYNGVRYRAIVGYYNYWRDDNASHVISYNYPIDSGDFYFDKDFVTDKELKQFISIPDDMWELNL